MKYKFRFNGNQYVVTIDSDIDEHDRGINLYSFEIITPKGLIEIGFETELEEELHEYWLNLETKLNYAEHYGLALPEGIEEYSCN